MIELTDMTPAERALWRRQYAAWTQRLHEAGDTPVLEIDELAERHANQAVLFVRRWGWPRGDDDERR